MNDKQKPETTSDLGMGRVQSSDVHYPLQSVTTPKLPEMYDQPIYNEREFRGVVEELQRARKLLYRCIKELYYVQSAEHVSQCASAEGVQLVEMGMRFLGVKDLSQERLED